MKALKFSILVVITSILIFAGVVSYLYYLAAAATYPEDSFLKEQSNKTALIIVAHDDDAVSMAGTISALCKEGWTVRQMCFYQGWKGRDSIRQIHLQQAATIQGIKSIEFHHVLLRDDRENVQDPWKAIPHHLLDSIYNIENVMPYIQRFIQAHKPSVIFTLDDSIGGYGHPEHLLISRLTLNYCRKYQKDSTAFVKRIYQAVFDPRMNEKILDGLPAYEIAKEVYQFKSTPKPTVQISFKGFEEQKQQVMKAYTTEQHTLTKIWPFYHLFPARFYFGIFNKEYYKVRDQAFDYN